MRPEAARFSFLLSIPAILGAVVLKAKDFESISVPLPSLAIGFVAAAVVGYAALRLLVGFVNRGKLWWFAPYCGALGLLAIVFG
jgi:undecaprenyl-diphosphatase